ncbi:MAG TPA: DUF305 domain-containing protein [Actinomycetota bacterium]
MKKSYVKLGIALGTSLLVMYLLTFSMVERWGHLHMNLSNFYMALMMVAPMGIVMLLVMRSMFRDTRLNVILHVSFAVLFVAAFWLGRTETFIGDEGFLDAMIPHHSRAILVCQESSLSDPEVVELCDQIVETQREEIAQMERILDERY